MDLDKGTDIPIVDPDMDPIMTGDGPGADRMPLGDIRIVANAHHNDGEEDRHRDPHHLGHQMIGTPNSRSWMMTDGDNGKDESVDGIPRRSMSRNNSGRSGRGSRRWSVRTSNTQQPTRVLRT